VVVLCVIVWRCWSDLLERCEPATPHPLRRTCQAPVDTTCHPTCCNVGVDTAGAGDDSMAVGNSSTNTAAAAVVAVPTAGGDLDACADYHHNTSTSHPPASKLLHRASLMVQQGEELLVAPVSQHGGPRGVALTAAPPQLTRVRTLQRVGSQRHSGIIGQDAINRWDYHKQLQHQQQPKSSGTSTAAEGTGSGGDVESGLTLPAPRMGSTLATTAPHGTADAQGGNTMYSKEQMNEVELLLSCYHDRTVYVMGGTSVGISPSSGVLRAAVVSCYQFMSVNSQKKSEAWNVPAEQLVQISLRMLL
jgi:hypothetical protein